jgi:hypothetical protein
MLAAAPIAILMAVGIATSLMKPLVIVATMPTARLTIIPLDSPAAMLMVAPIIIPSVKLIDTT